MWEVWSVKCSMWEVWSVKCSMWEVWSVKCRMWEVWSVKCRMWEVWSEGTEEVSYDAVTPDSGVQDNFNALSPDEQDKLREEWKAELIKTEEEIQTLRQVLGAKVKTAQDIKRRLGITVWREFTDDFNSSMKTVRESQPVQKANEVITEITEAVSNAPLYRRMSGAFSDVGEAISQQPV
ncbi:hypothetical protein GWK47_045116 [Chionoecetes opilio]|uniref:Tumor protein D52 n=1 Tax=Chionoecetes opilio TaxID=41210 RepID=A0A8J4YE92_CHIOP|nr:hypothetical protein GWK47_045116 [Chionoecetes opilio]